MEILGRQSTVCRAIDGGAMEEPILIIHLREVRRATSRAHSVRQERLGEYNAELRQLERRDVRCPPTLCKRRFV
jgi:hypothetical protein